jgi:hypothetical protein
MMNKGDLIYVPAGTQVLQYNKEVETLKIKPDETYIGPAPIKFDELDKPMNLLLIEEEAPHEQYVKVYFKGEEWFISKKNIKLA